LKDILIIEGLDRLGKSTLIKNIQHRFGFYQVIHFGKPEILDKYRVEAATATPGEMTASPSIASNCSAIRRTASRTCSG
jgi:hypothetical protein